MIESIQTTLFMAFLLLLFNSDCWGSGRRNILNSVAYRIRHPSADNHGLGAAANKRHGWLRWAVPVVGVPSAIYFALMAYEKLS